MKTVADKKVAVVNYSGNVGKTVVASQLLFPRFEGCEYYHVETVNAGSDEGETLSGNQFGEILENIELSDSCVVDVGASNIEAFLTRMRSFKNSHDEIDYFIIPVTPSLKELQDTESVIDYLLEMGIPEKKLKIVYNKIERSYNKPESELEFFKGTIVENYSKGKPAIIYNSEYYPMLQDARKRHLDVINDTRDFNALKKAAETKDAKYAIILEKKLYQAALSAEEDLALAFANLKL
ncbi:MAG: hypothetical protein HLX50_18010 [Alteromonadaceae bacterium]|nr:hypothetical protein [Alteromonadaceae bacterium]